MVHTPESIGDDPVDLPGRRPHPWGSANRRSTSGNARMSTIHTPYYHS